MIVPEFTAGSPNSDGPESVPGLTGGGTELSIGGVTLSTAGPGKTIAGP
jgi:hypothetical protein